METAARKIAEQSPFAPRAGHQRLRLAKKLYALWGAGRPLGLATSHQALATTQILRSIPVLQLTLFARLDFVATYQALLQQ
jgi:hypothetical protein